MFQEDFALSLPLSSLLALWLSSHFHLYSSLTELGNNPSFLGYMNAYINWEQVDNEIPVQKSACQPGETWRKLASMFLGGNDGMTRCVILCKSNSADTGQLSCHAFI